MRYFVIGQTRSGSSLAMQMLEAAGIETVGRAPAYEPEETQIGFRWPDILTDAYEGKALKIIDHHVASADIPRDLEAKIIVTFRRSYRQQARSCVKFLRFMFGEQMRDGPEEVKRLAASFRQCNLDFYRSLPDRVPRSRFHVQVFEDTIRKPRAQAERLCQFLACGDPDTVAAVVRKRKPTCYPGMLELKLIEDAEKTETQNG